MVGIIKGRRQRFLDGFICEVKMSTILEDLKNSDPEIRELAIDKIGTIKPSNALEIILPFLSDSEPEVRGTAACNLGASD